jgi:hypothetical protein
LWAISKYHNIPLLPPCIASFGEITIVTQASSLRRSQARMPVLLTIPRNRNKLSPYNIRFIPLTLTLSRKGERELVITQLPITDHREKVRANSWNSVVKNHCAPVINPTWCFMELVNLPTANCPNESFSP